MIAANDSPLQDQPFGNIWHAKKRAFLSAFALTGVLLQAQRVSNVSRESHRLWLKEEGPDGDAYREAFKEAHEISCEVLEAEARRRAIEGVDEPVFHRGFECGTKRRYSDTLLIFMMKGAMPHKYRDDAGGGNHYEQTTINVSIDARRTELLGIVDSLRQRIGTGPHSGTVNGHHANGSGGAEPT